MSKVEKTKNAIKKTGVGIVGGIVVLIGIILIPYPGPGWLIVFAGLAILATEFESARRLLNFAKGKYDAWGNWLKHQPKTIQLIFWLLTFIVVVLTIWLLDGYGIINSFLHLGLNWVNSPFFNV